MFKNKKVIFINRYFYPDHSATSQILSDLVFYLVTKGFTVEIITSRLRYDDVSVMLDKNEIINNVKVNRLATTHFGRSNLLGRLIDYLSFYISALFYMIMHITSNDVIVVKTDPPLISVLVTFVAKFKGATQINWLQDLFPEVAKSLDVKGIKLIYPLLKKIRNTSLIFAFKNVVIGDLMSKRLQANNVDVKSIETIHNWSIEDNILPLDSSKNPLRSDWNLKDKFIVGYSGNIGRAHEFKTILNSAVLLKNNKNIVFVIIGGGALHLEFKEQVQALGLINVIFKPYQPIEKLQYSLTLADLHIISLIPSLEGLIVPSKFYGIAASGRPVLYIGSKTGEIPNILDQNTCGYTIEVGDSSEAVSIISQLANDNNLTKRLGLASRDVYEKQYTKQIAFNSWCNVLNAAICKA